MLSATRRRKKSSTRVWPREADAGYRIPDPPRDWTWDTPGNRVTAADDTAKWAGYQGREDSRSVAAIRSLSRSR